MSLENSSTISVFSPINLWTRLVDNYNSENPTTNKHTIHEQPPPSDKITTQNKVSEQSLINIPTKKFEAKDKETGLDFSKYELNDLLRLRDSHLMFRDKINHELVNRLNNHETSLRKLGIFEYVFEETSTGKKKLKSILNQIIDYFGDCCSEIHYLSLTRAMNTHNDYTLLRHFHGLRSLDLSHNDFVETWVFEYMPHLKTLTMDNCYRVGYKDLLEFRKNPNCREIANRLIANLINRKKMTLEDIGIGASPKEIIDFFGESSTEIHLLQELQNDTHLDLQIHHHHHKLFHLPTTEKHHG